MKKVLMIGGLLALMCSCKHECTCDVYITDEELEIKDLYYTSATESGYTKAECSVQSGTETIEGVKYRYDCYIE